MFYVKEGKVHLSQLNIFRQERREKEERQKKAKEMSEDHDKRKKGTKLKSDQLWALEDIMIDEETEQDWLWRWGAIKALAFTIITLSQPKIAQHLPEKSDYGTFSEPFP